MTPTSGQPRRPGPVPELINFQKWKNVSEGEGLTWAQPPPGRAANNPDLFVRPRKCSGAAFPVLRRPAGPCAGKGEGRLPHRWLLCLVAAPGTGGAPAAGAGAREPGARPRRASLCAAHVRSTRDCTPEPSAEQGRTSGVALRFESLKT